MSFIKKKFNLNGHAIFHSIIDNKQLYGIDQYHSILSLAQQDAQNIIDAAHIEANQMIEHANQNAHDIVNRAEEYQASVIQDAEQNAQTLLQNANEQVIDIISNSEHNAAQQVWDQAQHMIEQLQNAHNHFYEQTKDLVKGLLATIIKRLTQNLTVQERMYILVDQVFEKAKNIEYATLFFSAKDFQNLPEFHIPQTWKIEKDNMLDVGWVKLVGAGGEWKTSITSIQSKILKAIDYQGEALIHIPDDVKEYIAEPKNDVENIEIETISKENIDTHIDINQEISQNINQDKKIVKKAKPKAKPKAKAKEKIQVNLEAEDVEAMSVAAIEKSIDTISIDDDVPPPELINKPKRTRSKKTSINNAE
jgi:HrpE/YscL/FliH and V-type ATPase subunit E